MKRFLAAFLVLVFWQALDLRLHHSVVAERKPLDLNRVLELDESLELDSSAWDESGDAGSGDDEEPVPSCPAGLFPDNPLAVFSDLLTSETSRWRQCAAEKGAKVPLFLLYHYLKGY
mgnify:CR=1 FL=1